MKKTMIGCAFLITGALGYLAVMVFVAHNPAESWSQFPGRFATTVTENGLGLPLALSFGMLMIGFLICLYMFFWKDK